MIVIDVGCARYGGDYSIERLAAMFHPHTIYGFDPAQGLDEYPWEPNTDMANITVAIEKAAAWTYTGEVRFLADGLAGMVGDHDHWPLVPCIDLSAFIDEMPAGPLVLKLDCEGAEIDLLEHLIAKRTAARLTRVLVEWHPWNDPQRRRRIERALKCPVEQWRW